MGSRTPKGLATYLSSLEKAFTSVRSYLAQSALVCVLVAFRDPSHLPLFLSSLKSAGFELAGYEPVWREVPNRKWYAKRQQRQNSSREILLTLKPLAAMEAVPHPGPPGAAARSGR